MLSKILGMNDNSKQSKSGLNVKKKCFLEYKNKIYIFFNYNKIKKLIISPNNYNLLIVSNSSSF